MVLQIKKSGLTHEEFDKIERSFHETMEGGQYTITKIVRVQNEQLFFDFEMYVNFMLSILKFQNIYIS